MRKRIFSLILAITLSCMYMAYPLKAVAKAKQSQQKTVLEALKIDPVKYHDWLLSHEGTTKDDTKKMPEGTTGYYLGTPYIGYDHREPNGDTKHAYGELDRKGVAAMNCNGFVWHVMYKASGLDWKTAKKRIPRVLYSEWNKMCRDNKVISYKYKGKDAIKKALKDGHLTKGDIIEIHSSYDNHVGFFWDNKPDEDKFWHSLGVNKITNIYEKGVIYSVTVYKTYSFESKPGKEDNNEEIYYEEQLICDSRYINRPNEIISEDT